MGLKLQSYPPCTLQIQGYVLPKWWPCSANAVPARICKDDGVAHILLGRPDVFLWSCQDGRYLRVCSVARSHVDHFWHGECHLSHDGMQKRHCRLSSVNEGKNDPHRLSSVQPFWPPSVACGAYTSCGRPLLPHASWVQVECTACTLPPR